MDSDYIAMQKKISKEVAERAEILKNKYGISRDFVSDSDLSDIENKYLENQSLAPSCSTQSNDAQNFLQNMNTAGHVLPEGLKME